MGTAKPVFFFRMAPTGQMSMALRASPSESLAASFRSTSIVTRGPRRTAAKIFRPSLAWTPRTQRRHWMQRFLSSMSKGAAASISRPGQR